MKTTAPVLLVHRESVPVTPVVAGFPVPAGLIDAYLAGTVARAADGTATPVQCARLTPDSPRGIGWLEAAFLAPSAGHYTLEVGNPVATEPLFAESADGLRLCTGGLRVTLPNRGDRAPIVLERQGADGAWAALGTLTPELVTPKGVVHREATTAVRRTTLLRQGHSRVQAETHGRLVSHGGQDSFAYRLTVELWRDLPGIRVDFLLAHDVAGLAAAEVCRATLRGDWQVGDAPRRRFQQQNHGPYYKRRLVTNPGLVALLTDDTCGVVHVAQPDMLLDDADYAFYLQAPTTSTASWLALEGDDCRVIATVHDFAATRPNQLRSAGAELSYDLIPEGHLRRWPQGRRKQQTLLLTVESAATAFNPVEAERRLASLVTEGGAQAAPDTLREAGCFDLDTSLPWERGRNVRLNMMLKRLCNLETPSDKWDLGDTIDPGYTTTYPAVPNRLMWLPNTPRVPVRFDPAGRRLHGKLLPMLVEPVWTNNEYDIIHAIATEAMRSANAAHADLLRWTSRHVIETDFCCFSDDRWHHRAQPAHSAHHNTTGAYPSHFWTQGLLQYYAMTGDRDAEEVCLALGDKIIEHNHVPEMREWKFDRELGWGLLSLVCLLEAGYDRYRGEADAIAEFLMGVDREAHRGAVNLSAGRAGRTLERQMIDNAFGFTSMVEAMDRYQKVSGREDTAAWLVKLLRQLREETWNAIDEGEVPGLAGMVTLIMAIGYERTGEDEFLDAGMVILENFFDSLAMGSSNNWGFVKPNAMMYRALCRFLGHAHRQDLLGPYELKSLRERRRGQD